MPLRTDRGNWGDRKLLAVQALPDAFMTDDAAYCSSSQQRAAWRDVCPRSMQHGDLGHHRPTDLAARAQQSPGAEGRAYRAWTCVPSDIFLVPVLLTARVGIKGRQHDRPPFSLSQGAP